LHETKLQQKSALIKYKDKRGQQEQQQFDFPVAENGDRAPEEKHGVPFYQKNMGHMQNNLSSLNVSAVVL